MSEQDLRMAQYLTNSLELIEKHGWMLQGVFSTKDDPGPSFVYTVGLTVLGHPELIIFGLPHNVAGVLLNEMGDQIRKTGRRYVAGELLPDLLDGDYVARLIKVDDTTEHLTLANRIYGHGTVIEALQVVWPDKERRYPWDEGFALPLLQPLLGTP